MTEEERAVIEAAKRVAAKYATVPDLDRLREAVADLDEAEGREGLNEKG